MLLRASDPRSGPKARWRVGPAGRTASTGKLAWAVVLAGALVGGCAGVDPGLRTAEREAAVARWARCVERHGAAYASSMDAIDATRNYCDGHRRDVARTFAPHLEPHVQARLAERERTDALRARATLSEGTNRRAERLLLRMAEEKETF